MIAPTMTEPNPRVAVPAKQRIRQAFDQAASTYDAAADVQREVCDRLGTYLTESGINLAPAAILDAGCGTGYGVRWLAQRWLQARLVLIDFAPGMLATARARCVGAELICADIEALPVRERSFDLYWSSLAWQWNNPWRCLAESKRVLKPGGALAVATLGADNFPELRHAFAEIDDYAHVLAIRSPEGLLAECQAGEWRLMVWQRQPVRRHFIDVPALLRCVKEVGAREVGERRPAPFGRSAWRAIIARYERLREPEGLPLTYDVAWLIATR